MNIIDILMAKVLSGGGGGGGGGSASLDVIELERYSPTGTAVVYCKITFPDGKDYFTDPALTGIPFLVKDPSSTKSVICASSEPTTGNGGTCTLISDSCVGEIGFYKISDNPKSYYFRTVNTLQLADPTSVAVWSYDYERSGSSRAESKILTAGATTSNTWKSVKDAIFGDLTNAENVLMGDGSIGYPPAVRLASLNATANGLVASSIAQLLSAADASADGKAAIYVDYPMTDINNFCNSISNDLTNINDTMRTAALAVDFSTDGDGTGFVLFAMDTFSLYNNNDIYLNFRGRVTALPSGSNQGIYDIGITWSGKKTAQIGTVSITVQKFTAAQMSIS